MPSPSRFHSVSSALSEGFWVVPPDFDLGGIANYVNHALASTDTRGQHVWWNPAYEEFAGLFGDPVGRTPLAQLLGAPPTFEKKWQRVVAGESLTISINRLDAHGTSIYGQAKLTPFRAPGSTNTVIAVSIDDRTDAQRALFDLQRYASMVAYSMDAIISLDQRKAIQTWNAGAQNLYGYTADEVLGKPLTMLSSEGTLLEDLPDRVLCGEVVEGEDAQKCRNGTILWVSVQASPIYHRTEGINGVSIIARDVTDRRQMEEELRAAKNKAEQAAVAKSQFLANMSHEIRTPMNGVLGMTDLLLDTELDREQRQYAETVKCSGDTLLQLINDILDFSKIEAGRLELEDIPFDLSNVCNGVLDVIAQLAADKGLELTGFVDLDLPPQIMGDPSRLRQVLLNLTNNAVKFTAKGEVALRIFAVGEVVRFEVRDTGIGIPADRAGRLFKAFSQVDASTTRRFGGTGLGLAISRELVELMGGHLRVDSEQGVGSRFWFELPLRAVGPLASLVEPAPVSQLQGLRVLVVDDVAASAQILQSYCEAWGSNVVMAPNADEATREIERAEREPFSIILLDNGLPTESGLELGRRWRQRWPGLSSALVLLTSYAERGDARRASDAGFAAYLTKPTKKNTLRETLCSVLGHSASQRVEDQPRRLVTRHTISEHRRRKSRILVAEDNVVNQQVTLRMLERLGYRPTLVTDGQAAVQAFAEQPFDVVLMDCQMPIMDGYEAATQLRSMNEAGARVPIVALTAHAMTGDRAQCLAAGMSHYLSKPVSAQALADMLENLLEETSS